MAEPPGLQRRLAAHLRPDRPAAESARDVLVTVAETTGADEAVLYAVDGGALLLGESPRWPEPSVGGSGEGRYERVEAVRRAAETGRRVMLPARRGGDDGREEPPLVAAAALPLVVGGHTRGVLDLAWSAPRPLAQLSVERLDAIAEQVAVAADWVLLQGAEEAARRRLDVLTRLIGALPAARDLPDVTAALRSSVMPTAADALILQLRDERGALHVEVCHRDPRQEAALRSLAEHGMAVLSPAVGPGVMADVARTGTPLLLAELPSRLPDVGAPVEEAGSARDLAYASALVVPLQVGTGDPLGLLLLLRASPGPPFGAADLQFACAVGGGTAQALANVRQHARAARVATTLRRSVVPQQLPRVPGIEVAARYLPFGDGEEIGGDFHDVQLLSRRRAAVFLGEVSGRGVEAAAVTSLVRHTLRAAAQLHEDPVDVLRTLHQSMLAAELDERYATVAYVVLDLQTWGAALRIVLAGHPAPLLVSSLGQIENVGAAGSAVGLLPEASFTTARADLRPGDLLVLYTDGATTQARSPGGALAGETVLRHTAARSAGAPPVEAVDRIVSALASFSGGEPNDDLTVLAVRVGTAPTA